MQNEKYGTRFNTEFDANISIQKRIAIEGDKNHFDCEPLVEVDDTAEIGFSHASDEDYEDGKPLRFSLHAYHLINEETKEGYHCTVYIPVSKQWIKNAISYLTAIMEMDFTEGENNEASPR